MDDLYAYITIFPERAFWYHGSEKLFRKFVLPKRYSPNEQLGFGIHFALNKSFAELYGNIIYRCHIHPTKVLNLLSPIKIGTIEDELGKEMFRRTGHRPYIWDNMYYYLNPDIRPPKRAEEIIRSYGYDAVFYKAQYGSRVLTGGKMGARYTNETPSVIMLDCSGIEIIDYEIVEKH